MNLLALKKRFQRMRGSFGARKGLFADENGMTSAGMAVSLLVCLSLVFSSAQVYRVSSASSEIQEVADVCALAAENEVAEFMVAANVCDATILSLTLLAATTIGIGIVCACIPPAATLSEQMLSFGQKIVSARDKFSQNASQGLDSLQKTLPFLAASSAFCMAKANENGAMNADYLAMGILVSSEGKPISVNTNDGLSEFNSETQNDADDIRASAAAAEEAAKKANESKERAFNADCGNAPDRCQYERAARLSSISSANNPVYASVDTWSFSVALDRARSYYRARLSEPAPSGSVKDKASYHLRMRFYQYASSELTHGYANENGDAVSLYFPKLFRNTNEFKQTSLYTERVYPISPATAEGGCAVIHAYSGCPAINSVVGHGSVQELDAGTYTGCEICNFCVESMGNIASASTNVSTGFEYHYEKIRQASLDYQQAMDELSPLKEEVKGKVNPLLDKLSDLLSGIGGQRIDAQPPGSVGCISLVVNNSRNSADVGFESFFVGGGSTMGDCAAVSAATLVKDTSHKEDTIITSLLDGFDSHGGAALGAGRVVLDLWSGLLRVYEDGQSALSEALSSGLSSVSTNTLSGLGRWAADALSGVVSAAGLAPADTKVRKPVILNTGYVASADSGTFAVKFAQVKDSALASSSSSTDLFTGIMTSVSQEIFNPILNSTFTVAEIEFPVGDIKIPITITLPESIQEGAAGLAGGVQDAIASAVGSVTGLRVWQ